jgi:hypothetical protein
MGALGLPARCAASWVDNGLCELWNLVTSTGLLRSNLSQIFASKYAECKMHLVSCNNYSTSGQPVRFS